MKKTVHGMETYWLSSKENVLVAVVSKEGNADNVLRLENTLLLLISFKKKSANENCASSRKLLWQNSPYLFNNTCTSTKQ